MKIIKIFSLLIIFSPHFLFGQSEIDREKGLIYLQSNLEVLASDLFEGRETATRGEKLAALFISEELTKYGVKPFGDEGTFFQKFDLIDEKVEEDSKITIKNNDGITKTLKVGEDFYLSLENNPSEKFNNEKQDIVFAGYGISADGYNYNNYNGVDAHGKVVLLMSGTPSTQDEDQFSKDDEKKFSHRNHKYKNAIDHGAVGIIYILSGRILKYWKYWKNRALASSVSLLNGTDSDDDIISEAIPVVILSEESAVNLLSEEKYSYDGILAEIEKNKIPAGFDLSSKVTFDYKIVSQVKEAQNMVGIIKGTDDELKNQFIVLSAHYDHEGIIDGEIYNGADDNGSGTVAILEAGRRLALLNDNRRSIVIVFHTGEEKGLLGSKYLTQQSDFMKNVVANINIDMVGREDTELLYSIGSGKLSTELYELVERVNSETVKFELDYTFDDPSDPNRYYYRSDHYNYAKQNIPIVFFYDHMTEDYHKPTDDVKKINFEKIEKVSTLITELALRIANLDHKLILDIKEKENVDSR